MGFVIELGIISLSLLFIATFIIKNRNPPAILGIYQRPNGFFYFKFIFMFIILSLKKLGHKFRKRKQMEEITALDRPQKLSAHPKAIDAVYFNGANKHGDYLVVGTARRKNKLVDGFLYLLVESSGFGLLETPKLPGTALYQSEESEEFAAEGLRIEPQVPMGKWRISYEGKMKRFQNRKEFVDVKIEAEWSSTLPYFNFDSDMDPWAMATSMAYETFSREYFQNLKANHQTHYEQHGDIKGVAIINGRSFNIEINAVRDHSFGLQREWRNFHRYGLHFVTAENGDRFNVGKICLPISFSRLTIGYVYSAEDGKIHPVRSCDLELHQHGEGGDPPEDYAFSFETGKKRYVMQVNVVHSPHFYISKDWESKVVERLCTFEINGMKGWGAAEWQYRNVREKKCKCSETEVKIDC